MMTGPKRRNPRLLMLGGVSDRDSAGLTSYKGKFITSRVAGQFLRDLSKHAGDKQ